MKRKAGYISILLLLFIFIIPISLYGEVDNYKAIILEGDRLFENRIDIKSLRMAIEKYSLVANRLPSNIEAMWKLGEAFFWLGKLSKEKGDQKEAFQQGIYYSRKGVELDKNCVECHFWLGINLAKFGEIDGIFKSISMLDNVIKEMEKVIELDPSFSWGGGYRVIGRIYYKLPWFLGGDIEKSFEYLKKALSLAPEYPLNILFFADTLIELKKYNMAEAELKKLRSIISHSDSPENRDIYNQADILLNKINKIRKN